MTSKFRQLAEDVGVDVNIRVHLVGRLPKSRANGEDVKILHLMRDSVPNEIFRLRGLAPDVNFSTSCGRSLCLPRTASTITY